jgi:excisionase family DNA binding protein
MSNSYSFSEDSGSQPQQPEAGFLEQGKHATVIAPTGERRRKRRRSPPSDSPLTINSVIDKCLPRTARERLLTVGEVASQLSVSRACVYRLAEGRKIPFIRIGGIIRFVSDDVDLFLQSRRIDPIL